MSTEDRVRLAEARHRAYSLVGRLVLEGLGLHIRDVVAALPELDAAVPGEDPERWAVDHQRVWGFQVAPYESVFLGEEGLLGGPVSASVSASYAASGLSVGRRDTEPDHLGLELAHCAFLCAAERDALVDGEESAASRLVALQRGFLEQHLLRWLPAVLAAVDGVGGDFERAVVALVAEMVADHAGTVGAESPRFQPGPPEGLEGLLDDPKTGVKRIARALLQPGRAGWWLSTARIGAAAAAAGVPEGFGPRVKKLESVVFAAVDHDALPALVAALLAEVESWEDRYARLEELGLAVDAWQVRLAGTRRVLERMAEAV